jgi:hypothetical protein
VKCLDGAGKACHTMRLFPSTHLEAELIPETLIKRCLGHGKKGVTEQSYIKIMGRRDVRRKYVESVGLGFSHVPSVPTSPRVRLKRQRNYHKMGMVPGSSTVEHSALQKLLLIS